MDREREKKTDRKLMKRLLSYVKPYWFWFLIALVMLVGITFLELVNPYLLKVAIDDYITLDKRVVYDVGDHSSDRIRVVDGRSYISKSDLKREKLSESDYEEYRIVKEDGAYFLENSSERKKIQEADFEALRKRDISGIKHVTKLFFLVIFFTFLFSYAQAYLLNYTGQRIIYNIRNEVFNHIQNLSLTFFDNTAIGRLVTRVNNDTETLNEMFTSVLINLFKDVFTLLGIIFIMIRMDYRLALFAFAFLPFFILISIRFRKHIRIAYRRSRERLSAVNSKLNEYISGITTIQIFNKEEKINEEFDKINASYLEASKKEIQIHATLRPAIEVVRSLAIAILIYFGGNKVIGGSLPFGTLYIFIDYMQRFFQPIFELTEKYNILQSAMTSSERIFAILDNEETIKNPESPRLMGEVEGRIEFKNVWFAYEEDNWILKDISFVIEPGESVAFVGPTGAGKTSIINLITRFYDIQKGEILIDGVNIREIDKFELRRNIGVVLQDVFLFAGTIEDNIRLLNKDISRNKVVEVARYVNADKFICKLPQQYDEPVMERGATLSSGERQLLSFARTLAHDPKILILDEATANIDTETELLIQDAIARIIENRTSIAIAHRLSTIQNVDTIIVLDHGEIIETGNHQELLSHEGMYYDLYKLQYKDELIDA